MRNEIWVVCEQAGNELHPVSKELLGEARRLADSCAAAVAAVLFGERHADTTISHGADTVYCFSDAPSEHACAIALADLAKEELPIAVLLGSTVFGHSVAPQAAALLQTGLTADCTALSMEDGRILVQRRPAYGGHILAEITGVGPLPQMATVRRGVMRANAPDPARTGRVVRVDRPLPPDPFTLLSRSETAGAAGLIDASVILAGGLGAGRAGFALMRRIAERTGCRVAASRAAVNAGLAPYAEQVGQTGVTVRPKLYIACGISGSVQHLAGMSGAECVIAVNTDAKADIFDHADHGFVGDCLNFLEQLEKNHAESHINHTRVRLPRQVHPGPGRI